MTFHTNTFPTPTTCYLEDLNYACPPSNPFHMLTKVCFDYVSTLLLPHVLLVYSIPAFTVMFLAESTLTEMPQLLQTYNLFRALLSLVLNVKTIVIGYITKEMRSTTLEFIAV